jgi:hypothetical protein
MKKPFAVRQGDVMLFPSTIPTDAVRIASRPLAYGEKTGHHHSLVADEVAFEDAVDMYEKDGQIFVSIKDEGVSLVHQEHKAHPSIVPGDYKVTIQQENTDWGSRAVLD